MFNKDVSVKCINYNRTTDLELFSQYAIPVLF